MPISTKGSCILLEKWLEFGIAAQEVETHGESCVWTWSRQHEELSLSLNHCLSVQAYFHALLCDAQAGTIGTLYLHCQLTSC